MAGVAYRSTGIVSDKPMTARMAEVKISCDAGISFDLSWQVGVLGFAGMQQTGILGKVTGEQSEAKPSLFFVFSFLTFNYSDPGRGDITHCIAFCMNKFV